MYTVHSKIAGVWSYISSLASYIRIWWEPSSAFHGSSMWNVQCGLRMEGFHLARSHSVVEKEESELSYARSAAELQHCRPQREAQEPSTKEFSEQF